MVSHCSEQGRKAPTLVSGGLLAPLVLTANATWEAAVLKVDNLLDMTSEPALL